MKQWISYLSNSLFFSSACEETEIEDGDIVVTLFHPRSHISKKKYTVPWRLSNVLQTMQTQRRVHSPMNPSCLRQLWWSQQTREVKGDGDS
jgi:hypothetical protein